MLSRISGRSGETIKLPNHTLLYGMILATLGVLVSLGALTRLYELREFFPLRLPDQVNEFILNYVPFILGTFITTVAALAGLIVGINWLLNGLKEMGRLRIAIRWAGDYYQPDQVSLSLKEGRVRSYDRSPSLIFMILGRFWTNAKLISAIPGEIVRTNVRFLWKAILIGVAVFYLFNFLAWLPTYLEEWGLKTAFVLPSPVPFYNLLAVVCLFKLIIAFSLIPIKRPGAAREMDSMIVEGKGHPSVFFAIMEEGSKIFAAKKFPNRISRSRSVVCDDGETLIGTLVESFPEYVRTSARPAALISLFLGSVMILTGFLQIILVQYPTFSVGYEDFFNLYFMSLLLDILLNVFIILCGKSFLDQGRSLMAVYRFRSSLVYLEAKGDYEKKVLPDLNGIVSQGRLFDPLSTGAFNVRLFSAEAISDSITPEGVRELVGLETSGRLAKDVSRLKYLPFQVSFQERYPSSWEPTEVEQQEEQEISEPPQGSPLVTNPDSSSPAVAGHGR
jgi:hypothetical protein